LPRHQWNNFAVAFLFHAFKNVKDFNLHLDTISRPISFHCFNATIDIYGLNELRKPNLLTHSWKWWEENLWMSHLTFSVCKILCHDKGWSCRQNTKCSKYLEKVLDEKWSEPSAKYLYNYLLYFWKVSSNVIRILTSSLAGSKKMNWGIALSSSAAWPM
jgi:hypothetical protein